MIKKYLRIILPLLLLLAVGGLLAAKASDIRDLVEGFRNREPQFLGTVEATILPHYAETSGKLVSAPLALGMPVEEGEIVAVLDDSQERYNIEQLTATLARKQAVLDELLSAVEPTERRQAENNVKLAQQALALAELEHSRAGQDYADAQLLYENGALTEKTLNDALYRQDLAAEAINTAATRLDSARQQAARIAKGVAPEKIEAAQADIELTLSQLRQSEENLARYTVRAAQSGTVVSKNYYAGAMVAAGYNLADIASQEERYLVAYVTEEYLYRLEYGQQLTIQSAETSCVGTLVFIDVQAAYTPKENQTAANRNKNSYQIKILLPAEAPWRPGQTAELVL